MELPPAVVKNHSFAGKMRHLSLKIGSFACFYRHLVQVGFICRKACKSPVRAFTITADPALHAPFAFHELSFAVICHDLS
ncbi:hypothetical protein [Melaminivora jejuensis]|uniref:hypothetical protein n=1 Tax=Melaminivora jejuensis TaxID=1267217 RepID=UPI001ADFF236|nr:hypothetical protein [Melaminivora jejuensis]